MATETWVLNKVLLYLTEEIFNVNFTSNGQSYTQLEIYIPEPSQQIIRYGKTSVYMSDLDGWTNEAYRTIVLDSPATGDLLTWLTADGVKQTPSTPRLSVDLTTLPGWASLSTGSHNIQIVAKANGYKDSAPSAAVQVEKAETISAAGTWLLNTNLTRPTTTQRYKVNFKYPGNTYTTTDGEIAIQSGNYPVFRISEYDSELGEDYAYCYYYTKSGDNYIPSTNGNYYAEISTSNIYYAVTVEARTIQITDGTDIYNTNLINWLQENATKQS